MRIQRKGQQKYIIESQRSIVMSTSNVDIRNMTQDYSLAHFLLSRFKYQILGCGTYWKGLFGVVSVQVESQYPLTQIALSTKKSYSFVPDYLFCAPLRVLKGLRWYKFLTPKDKLCIVKSRSRHGEVLWLQTSKEIAEITTPCQIPLDIVVGWTGKKPDIILSRLTTTTDVAYRKEVGLVADFTSQNEIVYLQK